MDGGEGKHTEDRHLVRMNRCITVLSSSTIFFSCISFEFIFLRNTFSVLCFVSSLSSDPFCSPISEEEKLNDFTKLSV